MLNSYLASNVAIVIFLFGLHYLVVLSDEVYYTPPPFSQGSDAEYHVVNEAIVARKPSTLSHLEAASMKSLGADEAIDYTQEDTLAVVNQRTQGAGVDVVLDTAGKETVAKSLY